MISIPPEITASILEDLRQRFERGHDYSLIPEALSTCFMHRCPVPDWVADGYLTAERKYLHFRVKTLGDAFGMKRPKGFHMKAARQQRELEFAVYNAVRDASNRGQSVDDLLFEEIGESLTPPIKTTTVKKYYSAVRQIMQVQNLQQRREK